MKLDRLSLAVAVMALSLTISSCGKDEKKEETSSDGPQTSQGRILEAARNAAEKANEKTRQLEETPRGEGE